MTVAQSAARALVLATLGRIRWGRLRIVDGPLTRRLGDGSPDAPCTTVHVHSPEVYTALLRRRGRGLAEAYADGWWDCDDLVALVRIAARALDGADIWRTRAALLTAPYHRLAAAARSNTRRRSRDNVERHYELGNDFFSLVLDETMGYSCALWERPDMEPADASRANLERVCRLLDLRPGDRLLELGSGWGGLALHAATRFGCHVSTVTISPAQHDHIESLARGYGVGDRVEVIVRDYRDLRGSWDKLVSLEMIESVGADHLDDFVGGVGRLLKPSGLAVLQAITTHDRLYRIDRHRRTFLNQLIFPGGFVPSIEAILGAVARRTDMRTIAAYDITPHYPPTLRAWRERLERNWPRIRALGRFDERFHRLWRLYFAWCEASFAERRVLDRQLVLAGPRWRGENRVLGLAPQADGEGPGSPSGAATPPPASRRAVAST